MVAAGRGGMVAGRVKVIVEVVVVAEARWCQVFEKWGEGDGRGMLSFLVWVS